MSILKKVLYIAILIVAVVFIYTNIAKAATVQVTTETLNLRKEASTDSNIVALISEGEECEVIGEEGDWYQVQYGDYTGYISKEYARVVDNGTDNTTDTSENNIDNNENGSNADDNTETNSNDITQANEENQSGSDSVNQTSNTSGFISATTNRSSQVRIVPLINGSIIDNLNNNTQVTVINQINGWAYIQTDTVSGWVRIDTLTIKTSNNSSSDNNPDDNAASADNQNNNSTDTSNDNTSDFTEKTMYTTDYVNIRKEASTRSDVLMIVEPNTSLTVVGETGDWYEVQTSQGNAYVSKELLSDTETTVTTRGSANRASNSNKTQDKTNDNGAEVASTSTSNSSTSSTKGEEVVEYAKRFLGVPYVYGGASTSGFDCSGFTMYVFNYFGISMRHGAQAQAKLGKAVSFNKSSKTSILNNLKAGDLVFFLDYETMDEIGHCGIYMGEGNFIHASSGTGYCVKIDSLLPGQYYNTRFCAARSIL